MDKSMTLGNFILIQAANIPPYDPPKETMDGQISSYTQLRISLLYQFKNKT
jgi:hypothetical protein